MVVLKAAEARQELVALASTVYVAAIGAVDLSLALTSWTLLTD